MSFERLFTFLTLMEVHPIHSISRKCQLRTPGINLIELLLLDCANTNSVYP